MGRNPHSNKKGKYKLHSPEMVEEAVEQVTGMPVGILLSPSPPRDITLVRAMLFYHYRKFAGLSHRKIFARCKVWPNSIQRGIARLNRLVRKNSPHFHPPTFSQMEEIDGILVMMRMSLRYKGL